MTPFFISPSTPPLILRIIAHWMSGNHITVNSSKTKCMLISRKRSQAHHLPPLYLPVEHCKYLDVWISSDVTWTKHVESVSCKARRLLGFMFRTFSPFCKPETIITLYKSQVLPVDYACMCGLGPTFEQRSVFAGVRPDIRTEDGLLIIESQCRRAQ